MADTDGCANAEQGRNLCTHVLHLRQLPAVRAAVAAAILLEHILDVQAVAEAVVTTRRIATTTAAVASAARKVRGVKKAGGGGHPK